MSNSSKPYRILMAAVKSDSGKTLITCGLLTLLARRGIKISAFKCGPDYIDPMFHRKIIGIDSNNLDIFFAGRDGVDSSIMDCKSEYAIIEGVMGIYDGIAPTGIDASSYDVADATSTPVILVVDASKMGRTVISIIKGILADDDRGLIKGIILNRMSKSYYDRMRPIIEDELSRLNYNVKLIGAMPVLKDVKFESRHLGLKLPDEISDIRAKLDIVADALEQHCDIKSIIDIMESADTHIDVSDNMLTQAASGVHNAEHLRLAVAYDEAFCFYYNDNFKCLNDNGIEIVYFSPLHDSKLPDDIAGILIGGGYPELYLDELSANTKMLDSIRTAIDKGIPSIAECGGFMYLHDYIEDMNGASYKMVGSIQGKCVYSGRLVRFGYISAFDVEEACSSDFINCIKGMKGHEFHYYDSTSNGEAVTLLKTSNGAKYNGMHAMKNSVWGFPHWYYESNPAFIRTFKEQMSIYSKEVLTSEG